MLGIDPLSFARTTYSLAAKGFFCKGSLLYLEIAMVLIYYTILSSLEGSKLNLLMTDTPLQVQMPKSGENRYIDLSQLKIGHCLGCFGCWVKTPGKCVIRDDATTVYPLIAKSENLIYVTRVCFGSYDVPMKTMLERAIPTQQAFLRLHNGEIHHVQRAVKEKKAVILAYGTESKEEQGLFQRLIERNANNMLFQSWRVLFVKEEQLAEAAQREVEAWEKS